MKRLRLLPATVLALALASTVAAQPTAVKPSATSAAEAARGDTTVLIPPQGGTARVPVLAIANVLLSFEFTSDEHAEPFTIANNVPVQRKKP